MEASAFAVRLLPLLLIAAGCTQRPSDQEPDRNERQNRTTATATGSAVALPQLAACANYPIGCIEYADADTTPLLCLHTFQRSLCKKERLLGQCTFGKGVAYTYLDGGRTEAEARNDCLAREKATWVSSSPTATSDAVPGPAPAPKLPAPAPRPKAPAPPTAEGGF